jgi:hypothetical protein
MADEVTGVEVGTAYVSVLPNTKGFHKAIAGDVDDASRRAGQSGGEAAGGAFATGFGRAAPLIGGALGGLFAAGKVKQFLGDSINQASDLAESQSKVNVVFGQSASMVETWSKSASSAMVMSQQQALETAGTYGNLFTALGMTQRAASDLSMQAVQLGADLASFNNADPTDTLLAIRSALVGEYEPMRTYGSALSMVRVQQEALNAGLWDGHGALTASAQAQAVFNLLLRDTKNAQGDVARTGSGYANTLRAISASWTDLQADVGKQMLASIQSVSQAIGGADGVNDLFDAMGDKISRNIGLAGQLVTELAKAKALLTDGSGDGAGGGQSWSQQVWDQIFGFFTTTGLELPNRVGETGRFIGSMFVPPWMRDGAWQTGAPNDPLGFSSVDDSVKAFNTGGAMAVAQKLFKETGDAATFTATGIGTLQQALDRFDERAKSRQAGTSVREQWRSLSGMGESKTVKVDELNPKWRPGSSVPKFVQKSKSVKMPFDPDVVGGRFAFTASGDAARDWAATLGQRVLTKAESYQDPFKAQAFTERWLDRLGGQFKDWGIRNPYKYAKSFLPDPDMYRALTSPTGRTAANRDPLSGGDVFNLNNTTVYTSPSADMVERLKQNAHQARASRVPHGALGPTR